MNDPLEFSPGTQAFHAQLHLIAAQRSIGWDGGRTGSDPGLLQDDHRGLFQWFVKRIGSRQTLREVLNPIADARRKNRS
jgi:hypothetical protein